MGRCIGCLDVAEFVYEGMSLCRDCTNKAVEFMFRGNERSALLDYLTRVDNPEMAYEEMVAQDAVAAVHAVQREVDGHDKQPFHVWTIRELVMGGHFPDDDEGEQA